MARQRGEVVDTDKVAPEVTHPLHAAAPERAPDSPDSPTWDKVFDTWRDYVENRPKPTTIASQTPWRDLRRFAEGQGVRIPGDVTPELMTAPTSPVLAAAVKLAMRSGTSLAITLRSWPIAPLPVLRPAELARRDVGERGLTSAFQHFERPTDG